MNGSISSVKLIVTGLAFLFVAAAVGYEWLYVWPIQKCERQGAWWDPRDHQCLTPMPIWNITHRGGPPTPPVVVAKP